MDAEPARTPEAEAAGSGGGPAGQLDMLLARADRGALAERHLAGVRDALMHYCALQSCRHTKGPPRPMDRRTHRHSFLLPDGSVRMLWELEHNTGGDGEVRYAVFAEPDDLAVAEWDVDTAFGAPAGPVELPPFPRPLRADVPRTAAGAPPGAQGDVPARREPGCPDGAEGLLAPVEGAFRRAYTEGDSPEHAWRLLRRAANPGAPGADMLARLRAAIAHDITIIARRSTHIAGRPVSWSLYEHAFLLLDGSEVSLWEIDHTRTPNGDPVCEVFTSRDAALDTAVRRIEAG